MGNNSLKIQTGEELDMTEEYEALLEFIADYSGYEASEITRETEITSLTGEVTTVQLIAIIEETFGLDLSDIEIESATIADVYEAIYS